MLHYNFKDAEFLINLDYIQRLLNLFPVVKAALFLKQS